MAIPEYLLESSEGIQIDLLFGNYPWLNDALRNHNSDPAGYPVISLPYLVILKLAALRAQDTADISRMLGWADDETLNKVREVVARYSPDDVDDLESLIFIGQRERGLPPPSDS